MGPGNQNSGGQSGFGQQGYGVGVAGGANPAPTQSYGGQGLGGFGGQQSYGGFGQQGMGYGGFGQGYGGFGGFQTPYAPQQSYGGFARFQTPYAPQQSYAQQQSYAPQQSYGTLGVSGQTIADYYQGSNPWVQNQAMSRYGISPIDVNNNVPLMGVNAATGKPYTADDIFNNTLNGYYAPPTNTKEGLNTPYYGTFNNFSAKDLRDYVGGLKTTPVQEAAPAAAAAPSMTDLKFASGNSGNAVWDKLVTDYIASHPIFQPGRGWAVNDYTKNEYQGLLDQYNKQVAADAAKAKVAAVPTLDSAGAQDLASAMQRYGVSANDLAQSGALSQADYTRIFRPSNQYQGQTNPNQYYQPIYQTQYQNYASPAFAYQGAQNNMRQSYQSPLQGIYGLLGGYR